MGREIPEIPFLRPGSPELAQAVKEALKEHNSAMLLSHGQVVCGKDFDDVFQRATFFEMACQICVRANMEPAVLDEETVTNLINFFLK